jgi:hypothetical protein
MDGMGYRAVSMVTALVVLLGAAGAILAAGTSPPGQPAGIYHARISGVIGSLTITEDVWYSAPDGRFRDTAVDELEQRQGRLQTLTVFNGASARTELTGRRTPTPITVYDGSPAFTSTIASGLGVNILASYLRGTPAPAAVRITVSHAQPDTVLVARGPQTAFRLTVQREPVANAGRLFRLPEGRVGMIDRQIQPNSDRTTGGYWLGPANGAPTFAFIDGRGDVTVLYPDLMVSSSGSLTGGSLPGQRVQLNGHTPASLVRAGPNGTIQVMTGGASIEMVGSGSDRFAGTAAALVFTHTASILLSGPAVSGAGAAGVASQLRPF